MALWAALSPTPVHAQGRETVTVDGQEVRILRDRYGVPHVFAPSARAVYFGDGYAVAEDRLAQLEKYRRAARGELAELVGPGGVSQDREARREGYTEEERQRQFQRLSAPLQEALQAYADGINAYLAACEKNGLPSEAKKLGIPIRPWRVTDTLAIGGMMARRFGGGGGAELRNVIVLNFLKTRFGPAAQQVFDDLLPLNDPASPTTIPASEDRPRRTERALRRKGSLTMGRDRALTSPPSRGPAPAAERAKTSALSKARLPRLPEAGRGNPDPMMAARSEAGPLAVRHPSPLQGTGAERSRGDAWGRGEATPGAGERLTSSVVKALQPP